MIVDTVGSDLERYRRRLTRNGRMVTIGLSAPALAAIGLSAVASGALRPVVSGVFSWPDIAAAHQAFSQGGMLGKQVIAVAA